MTPIFDSIGDFAGQVNSYVPYGPKTSTHKSRECLINYSGVDRATITVAGTDGVDVRQFNLSIPEEWIEYYVLHHVLRMLDKLAMNLNGVWPTLSQIDRSVTKAVEELYVDVPYSPEFVAFVLSSGLYSLSYNPVATANLVILRAEDKDKAASNDPAFFRTGKQLTASEFASIVAAKTISYVHDLDVNITSGDGTHCVPVIFSGFAPGFVDAGSVREVIESGDDRLRLTRDNLSYHYQLHLAQNDAPGNSISKSNYLPLPLYHASTYGHTSHGTGGTVAVFITPDGKVDEVGYFVECIHISLRKRLHDNNQRRRNRLTKTALKTDELPAAENLKTTYLSVAPLTEEEQKELMQSVRFPENEFYDYGGDL